MKEVIFKEKPESLFFVQSVLFPGVTCGARQWIVNIEFAEHLSKWMWICWNVVKHKSR